MYGLGPAAGASSDCPVIGAASFEQLAAKRVTANARIARVMTSSRFPFYRRIPQQERPVSTAATRR